jgi:hypothetical protein
VLQEHQEDHTKKKNQKKKTAKPRVGLASGELPHAGGKEPQTQRAKAVPDDQEA